MMASSSQSTRLQLECLDKVVVGIVKDHISNPMHASWAFIGRLQWCSHPRWTIIFWPKMLYEQLWTTCMLRKYRAFFYHHFVFRIKWTPNGFRAFATRYKELTKYWSGVGSCAQNNREASNRARGLTCQSPKRSGHRQQLVGAFSEKCTCSYHADWIRLLNSISCATAFTDFDKCIKELQLTAKES